jgi:hypothetical protein
MYTNTPAKASHLPPEPPPAPGMGVQQLSVQRTLSPSERRTDLRRSEGSFSGGCRTHRVQTPSGAELIRATLRRTQRSTSARYPFVGSSSADSRAALYAATIVYTIKWRGGTPPYWPIIPTIDKNNQELWNEHSIQLTAQTGQTVSLTTIHRDQ